jgi:Flp pilus assembly protein TadG
MARSSRHTSGRDFFRSRDGSVAVEFTFIAFPLFFMIFAILEVALYFTVDTILDNAAIETGRLVRTGQASAQGMTAQQFKDRLCDRMSLFAPGCDGRLSVDVRVIPQFNALPPDPLADGVFTPDEAANYTNGSPGDLVLVRVWYKQPLMTGFLSKGLSKLDDGSVVMSATTAFRNEPA